MMWQGGQAGGKGAGDGRKSMDEEFPQIFIGRLPPNVTSDTIEQLLANYQAFNVRLLNGKGCAFADFPSWGAAEKAIAGLNGMVLEGGEGGEGINVKMAHMKGMPNPGNIKPKVFIGGLAQGISEAVIEQVCSAYGTITEAKIHSKNPNSPPCAFVTFSSFTEAEQCIADLPSHEAELGIPGGKGLNVKFADTGGGMQKGCGKGMMKGGDMGCYGMGGMGGGMVGMGMGGMGMQNKPQMQGMKGYGGKGNAIGAAGMGMGGGMAMGMGGGMGMPGGQGAQLGRPSNGGPGCPPPPHGCSTKLFVGGLPSEATEDFVWGLMAAYGEVVEAKLHRKNNACPCGFVRFADQQQADLAVEMFSQHQRFVIKPADNDMGGRKRNHQAAFE